MVTIDGIGGVGKTTLALEVAYHYVRKSDVLADVLQGRQRRAGGGRLPAEKKTQS